MKAVRFFALVCGAALIFAGCDLFLNKPEKDAISGAEYEVWLSKAPHLSVRMELVPGSGSSNPPAGLISLADNRPKLEVPFNASFTVNPGFGFVEWQAYRAAAPGVKLEAEVQFRSLNASGTEVEVTAFINEELIITPFCAALPVVTDHNLPNATFERLPTNYPVEIRFNTPIDPESLSFLNTDNPQGTIAITGKADQGMNPVVRDLTGQYDMQKDPAGLWIRLEPLRNGVSLSNNNITIELGTGIRSRDYPIYMAESRAFSYGAADGPDLNFPVVDSGLIRGALGLEEEDVFFSGKTISYDSAGRTWPAEYALKSDEDGKRTVYLLFDAYKSSAMIKEISITEERVMDIAGRAVTAEILPSPAYPNENLRNADSPLALKYAQEFQKTPFVIPHTVQTAKEGVIRFYIQPRDSFGIGYSYVDAQTRGLYVEALLDLPPDPVAGIGGVYNRAAGTITLTWADPANVDLDYIDISWAGGTAKANAGEQRAVLAGIDSGLYNFTLSAVDRGGNRSAAEFPFNADSTIPSPVSDLQGSYNQASEGMVLSWTNPVGDTEAETIKISWSGTAGGSASLALSGPSQGYVISGIAPTNGAAYTVTVKTANALKESGGTSVTVYPDITPPGAVTVTPFYNQGSKTIAASWTDPADADLQEILLEWGITGEGIAGSQRIGRGQQSYVITGVVSDSRGYTVRSYAVDRAGNQSAGTSKTVETDTTPPGAVWGLAGSYDRDVQRITVTWTDPVDPDLKEIRLAWQAGTGVLTSLTLNKGEEAYAIDSVGYNSGQYSITVTAADRAGNVGNSETVNVRTDSRPATPGSITAVNTLNSGELKVSWNKVSGASGYDLRYGTVSSGLGATELGISDGGTNPSTTLSGLTDGTVYYVWVRAKNGTVSGDYNTVPIIGTPKSSNAALGTLSIDGATLTPPFMSGTSNYSVLLPADSNQVTVHAAAADSNAVVSYGFDSGSLSGINYKNINNGAVVQAKVLVTAAGGATNNYTITVTRKLAAPAAPAVSRVAGAFGQLSVSWGSVSGATNYTLAYRKTIDADTPVGALTQILGNVTTKTLTGLEPGASYYVWVKAGNSNAAAAGDYSPSVTGTLGSNTAKLEILLVNDVSVDTSSDTLAGVTIPNTSNAIVLIAVPWNNGTARYKFGDNPLTSTPTGNINPGQIVPVQIAVKSEDGSATTYYTINVTRLQQAGIAIDGAQDPIAISPEKAVSISWGRSRTQEFTVSGTGISDTIQWYVDGVKLPITAHSNNSDYGTTASVTLYARDYLVSDHTLTVKVITTAGVLYTRELKFTVTQ
ncbi:fibronectin type III domain-containing protein [Treponema primitia]|uniref:fibronectin type III domain-containing protein n=1 Tax=Treponema primitia TaxID=88058 RepID=UPI0002F71183|nr:fibronectin type III domain-containing protein [Treponema primitia]